MMRKKVDAQIEHEASKQSKQSKRGRSKEMVGFGSSVASLISFFSFSQLGRLLTQSSLYCTTITTTNIAFQGLRCLALVDPFPFLARPSFGRFV